MFRSLIKHLKQHGTGGSKKSMEAGTSLEGNMEPETFSSAAERRSAFAVGCSRSGTHFVARLFASDPQVESYHMDDIGAAVGDSFLQFCAWNKLPVDLEGFFQKRQSSIGKTTMMGRVYFEANPYLSLSIVPLFERFGARFVYMVRTPEDTVNSHYVKGWYKETPVKSNLELSLGYQYEFKYAHHFFGRFVPHGEQFLRWLSLTRIGKIAWMWNRVNLEILRQLENLPADQCLSLRLEELDYGKYLGLCSFIDASSHLSEMDFQEIRHARPGKGPSRRTTRDWSELEREEFLFETKEARDLLGY
jgi:hypothetical protein